jgi:Arc/MetJ-type ribon-helix-helix transcriptional regulator
MGERTRTTGKGTRTFCVSVPERIAQRIEAHIKGGNAMHVSEVVREALRDYFRALDREQQQGGLR